MRACQRPAWPQPDHPGPVVRLSTLPARHIADHPGTPQQRRRWLLAARSAVERRIDAVVGGKPRGVYQRVAVLAIAYAEALTLAENPASGAAFITGTRARYPRHVAFRDEPGRSTSESPLLPAPPPRRR
jgi:hypothetical protein